MMTRDFGGRRNDSYQRGEDPTKGKSGGVLQEERVDLSRKEKSYRVAQEGRVELSKMEKNEEVLQEVIVNLIYDSGKENVGSNLRGKDVGLVRTSSVILGLVDGNVMRDVKGAVTDGSVMGDVHYFSQNTGLKSRSGVDESLVHSESTLSFVLEEDFNNKKDVLQDLGVQRQKKWKRRAREKGDTNINIDGDAGLRKRFLEEDENDGGLRKRGVL
ncbi:hypothetical protein ACOSP7_012227 [Xanthoceras sorbifolium]